MQNLLSKTPYRFKKSYGGTPEPQTAWDAPRLRGPSLKKSGLPAVLYGRSRFRPARNLEDIDKVTIILDTRMPPPGYSPYTKCSTKFRIHVLNFVQGGAFAGKGYLRRTAVVLL